MPPAGHDPHAPLSLAYLTYRGKPHVGGQGIYTRHLTKALVDLGHHVEVFAGQPYPVLDERVPLTKLPSLDIFNDQYPGRFPAYWEFKSRYDLLEAAVFCTGQFPEPLAFSARVDAHLSKRLGEFDLVHDNQSLGYGIAKLEEKIPLIVTLHHPITRDRALEIEAAPNWFKKRAVGRWYSFVRMQGKVASRVPRVVVVSENSINDIHTDMGVPMENMRLVPVGVDPELFRPLDGVEHIPGRLITTASADVAIKGLAYLIEAMAKLRADGADITLTVIGRAKPGKSMDLIEQYGLADHIEFVSGVPDERIVELYSQAELAVVPSLYEGFSLPAIEAMCSGTPLVATDGGALPEVTGQDGETVFRCRKGDADDLAATIRRALDNPDARARVGEAGRQRVLERWTWRRCAELTVEQYREVLAMPQNIQKLAANGRI
ncbi:glycosyltransferase involved in cell wall biosynthesis [Ilumatobacter fluminis]|uniref:Glycosyltransferase involved in cell wall biosynthesis n=1 Tax=Ilumatobacter fluminis TaxID=467091 RepID=A0A4R7HY10_9ACTN|nr:glycosyltransferase family 4 protein [Ilumatobacter fluminis]TDT15369.1 glycosyltransferase involved in cell wall biosynthesis [Ilumatobacter fluminis]